MINNYDLEEQGEIYKYLVRYWFNDFQEESPIRSLIMEIIADEILSRLSRTLHLDPDIYKYPIYLESYFGKVLKVTSKYYSTLKTLVELYNKGNNDDRHLLDKLIWSHNNNWKIETLVHEYNDTVHLHEWCNLFIKGLSYYKKYKSTNDIESAKSSLKFFTDLSNSVYRYKNFDMNWAEDVTKSLQKDIRTYKEITNE